MTSTGGWGYSGVGAAIASISRELLWHDHVVVAQDKTYSSAILDAGNTPTTDIRAGLLLGAVTASGELEEWDADATDGTQNLVGVNPHTFRTLDWDGTAQDRDVPGGRIVRAGLKASSLLIQGTALTDHVDEFLAREALAAMGCILDDDPMNWKAGSMAPPRYATVTGTTDTLTEAENGSVISYSNAASVTVTLPPIHPGLEYTLIRSGDEEFIVASGEGDNIVGINDLSRDSITFTTATEHLGVVVHVKGIYVGTTPKWLMTLPVTGHDAGGTVPATYSVAT